MKKLLLSSALILVISACSSGTSTSELPPFLSGAPYVGNFVNNDGNDRGAMTFRFTQDDNGGLTGLVIVERSICLSSGTITNGSVVGFNANFTVVQNNGGGNIVFALTVNNNSLSGSYTVTDLPQEETTTQTVTDPDTGEETTTSSSTSAPVGCSPGTGTGTVNASR
jgi:hypothetical protein